MGHIQQVTDPSDQVFFVDIHMAVSGGHGPHFLNQCDPGLRSPVVSEGTGEFEQVSGLVHTGFQFAEDVIHFLGVQMPVRLYCLNQTL